MLSVEGQVSPSIPNPRVMKIICSFSETKTSWSVLSTCLK